MNRHSFRWNGLAFGLFFLAVLGQWAVRDQDLLAPDELAYVAAAVLIVLGLLGIVGTAISARSGSRTAPFTPSTARATNDRADEPEPNDTETETQTQNETNDNAPTHGGNPA